MKMTFRLLSEMLLYILWSTSLIGRPVNGISMEREWARSTNTLYSLPASLAFEYATEIDLECFLVVSSNFWSTYLATTVLPLPVLPYNNKLEGLESCKIGDNICPIEVICSSRYGKFCGIKSVLNACRLVNKLAPEMAFSKIESNGSDCFCICCGGCSPY